MQARGVDCLVKKILLGLSNLTLVNIYSNLLWTSLLDKHLIIIYRMNLSYLPIEVYTYALQLTLITKVVWESLPILHMSLVNNQRHWNLRLCKHVKEYNIFCYMDEHFIGLVSDKNNNMFSMKLS
jgi:hypothetical protein